MHYRVFLTLYIIVPSLLPKMLTWGKSTFPYLFCAQLQTQVEKTDHLSRAWNQIGAGVACLFCSKQLTDCLLKQRNKIVMFSLCSDITSKETQSWLDRSSWYFFTLLPPPHLIFTTRHKIQRLKGPQKPHVICQASPVVGDEQHYLSCHPYCPQFLLGTSSGPSGNVSQHGRS